MAHRPGTHKSLNKLRVRITYEVLAGDSQAERELPFVVGVLGDFSGNPAAPRIALSDRKFVEIDRDNFNAVMESMLPGVDFRVGNTLMGDGTELVVQLQFNSMDDFEPAAIARQVEPLRELLGKRSLLKKDQASEQTIGSAHAISAIDEALSNQLSDIMHHPDFQKLEASWRGLHYLVMNSNTDDMLKIKVLNVAKRELFQDAVEAAEFDQSQIFKKVYDSEFCLPGGEPYGVLIGDYEFTNDPDDIELLTRMSSVAATAFCPFISAASAAMFGFDNWTELAKPHDLGKIFDAVEYTRWKSYRSSEDSRFVALVVPRVLSRLPYGTATKPAEEFNYDELKTNPVPHEHYAWMNAAYVLGTRLTAAFSDYGLCVAIQGCEGGGRVEGLPVQTFLNDSGEPVKCSTEIAFEDRREFELPRYGFLPLAHYMHTEYSVFFTCHTTHKPATYCDTISTANAAIMARLPFLMAASRFLHYLILIALDQLRINAWASPRECETRLNRWIVEYVAACAPASWQSKARWPLRCAKVELWEVPGAPDSYKLVAYLQPWLQLEELTRAMRLVAKVCRGRGTEEQKGCQEPFS